VRRECRSPGWWEMPVELGWQQGHRAPTGFMLVGNGGRRADGAGWDAGVLEVEVRSGMVSYGRSHGQ
jgi:hypothetical protein